MSDVLDRIRETNEGRALGGAAGGGMKREQLPAPKPQTPSERARRLFEVLRAALPAMTAEEFAESEKKLAERCGVTL